MTNSICFGFQRINFSSFEQSKTDICCKFLGDLSSIVWKSMIDLEYSASTTSVELKPTPVEMFMSDEFKFSLLNCTIAKVKSSTNK